MHLKLLALATTATLLVEGIYAHPSGSTKACNCEGSANLEIRAPALPVIANSKPSQTSVSKHSPRPTRTRKPGPPTHHPSPTSRPTSPSASPTPGCTANSNWPGFSNLKNAFVFGDSYTSTGFNGTGVQPSATNPMGNPKYPGYTSANGPNWIDFLTVKYNASMLLTYNLAYGGATIDSTLVAPYLPTVSSVSDQVEKLWFPVYAGKPDLWTSSDTLFAFFDGINDVGNSWSNGAEANSQLYDKIFTVWRGLLDDLYDQGARNFAFVNVPPVDRSPLALANTPDQQAVEKAAILYWNDLITDLGTDVKKAYPDTNIFTTNAWDAFTEVLDDPTSFVATENLKNTTAYCTAYQNGTPNPSYFNATCGVPVDQYFWLNSLHPTYPMQDVLAQEVAKSLQGKPSIC